jgi:hypothetical protein
MKKELISNIIWICAIVSLASCSAVWAGTGEFNPVDPNQNPEILAVIANGVGSNYDKIRTWQGKVEISEDYIYRDARAEKVFKEETDGNGEIPKTVKKHKERFIEFSLDTEKELLYAHYYPVSVRPLQYTDLQSGRDLGAKGIANNRRAILTPQYELHCSEHKIRDNAFISRKAVKEARRKDCKSCTSNLPPVYDPRPDFSPFKSRIPDLFPRLVAVIKEDGRCGIDDYDLVVEERKSGDISEYRVIMPSKRSLDSQEYIFTTLIFRSDKSFNITSHQRTVFDPAYNTSHQQTVDPIQNGVLLLNRTWSYDLVDGVHIPSKMTRQEFDWPNGKLTHERTETFKNQKVNKPIPKDTFNYKNLGLQDGDKFIDKIQGKEYVYKDSMLAEVEVKNK